MINPFVQNCTASQGRNSNYLIHPDTNYIKIRQHVMEIVGSDFCRAAILELFERWTSYRKVDLNRIQQYKEMAEESGEPCEWVLPSVWLYEKVEMVCRSLFDGYERKKVMKELKWLVDNNFLSAKKSPNPRDRSKMYALNINFYQEKIWEWVNQNFPESEKGFPETPVVDVSPKTDFQNLGSKDFRSPKTDFLHIDPKKSSLPPLTPPKQSEEREKKFGFVAEEESPGVEPTQLDLKSPSQKAQESPSTTEEVLCSTEEKSKGTQDNLAPESQEMGTQDSAPQNQSSVDQDKKQGLGFSTDFSTGQVPPARSTDVAQSNTNNDRPIAARVVEDPYFGGGKKQPYNSFNHYQHEALIFNPEDPSETPWLIKPTRVQKTRFNQDFVAWGARTFVSDFGSDYEKARINFQASLRNNPDKIVDRWEQYERHYLKMAVAMVARKKSGGVILEDEVAELYANKLALVSSEFSLDDWVNQKYLGETESDPDNTESLMLNPMLSTTQEKGDRCVNPPPGVATLNESDHKGCAEVYQADTETAMFFQQKYERMQQIAKSVKSATPKCSMSSVSSVAAGFLGGNPPTPDTDRKLMHWRNMLKTNVEKLVDSVVDQVQQNPKYEIIWDGSKPVDVRVKKY